MVWSYSHANVRETLILGSVSWSLCRVLELISFYKMEGKKFIVWNVPFKRVVIHRACGEALLQVTGRTLGKNKETFMEED